MGSTDQRLDRLTMIVDALAATAVAHDNQFETQARNISAQGENIDGLIALAKEERAAMAI